MDDQQGLVRKGQGYHKFKIYHIRNNRKLYLIQTKDDYVPPAIIKDRTSLP